MSSGKGKGRASVAADAANQATVEQSSQVQDSVLQRIMGSAVIFSSSTLAPPCRKEMSDHTSATLEISGKGQGIGGRSESSCAESSEAPLQDIYSLCDRGRCQTIKDYQREHNRNSEAEFSTFLNSRKPSTPAFANVMHSPPAKIESLEGFAGDLLVWEYAQSKARQISRYASVAKQQENDGEAVLAILSELDGSSDTFQEEAAFDWPLDSKHIFHLSSDTNVHESILDQLPSLVSKTCQFTPFIDSIGKESFYYLGHPVEEEAWRTWIGEWAEVLTHYTDEVWGGLLSLVGEAKEELDAMKRAPQPVISQETKALRRLGLILSHLQQT